MLIFYLRLLALLTIKDDCFMQWWAIKEFFYCTQIYSGIHYELGFRDYKY